MKVLFLGKDIGDGNTGGDYGTFSHIELLTAVFGKENVDLLLIPPLPYYRKLFNVLLRRGFGYSGRVYKLLKKRKGKYYDAVFCNSSVYGEYVRYFKINGYCIYTFFQNIEYSFYYQRYKKSGHFFDYIWFRYIYKQERLTIQNSNYTIVLNDRDSSVMYEIYGRKSDYIIPIFFKNTQLEFLKGELGKYSLFVGSNFYANNEGIEWFVKNVASKIHSEIWIVGTCCDYLKRSGLQIPTNVKLLGRVDDLNEIYLKAACVVTPIFSGSGMKTKTIEAFLCAKTVFGTPESFAGIEGDFTKIGGKCSIAEEFVSSINKYMEENNDCYNSYTYSLFQHKYSFDVNKQLLASILK